MPDYAKPFGEQMGLKNFSGLKQDNVCWLGSIQVSMKANGVTFVANKALNNHQSASIIRYSYTETYERNTLGNKTGKMDTSVCGPRFMANELHEKTGCTTTGRYLGTGIGNIDRKRFHLLYLRSHASNDQDY